jgi:CheY-like chemotaxis protein
MSISSSSFPVMLVDDNVDDLFVLRQRLLRGGIENPILSFEDGEEAMAHLKRTMADPTTPLPAVMFLDLRMPRCGGFEVLKWVRSQEPLNALRVVIVSTSALPEDAARAQQLGALQFLSKYPSPETLAEIVKAATERRAK